MRLETLFKLLHELAVAFVIFDGGDTVCDGLFELFACDTALFTVAIASCIDDTIDDVLDLELEFSSRSSFENNIASKQLRAEGVRVVPNLTHPSYQ